MRHRTFGRYAQLNHALRNVKPWCNLKDRPLLLYESALISLATLPDELGTVDNPTGLPRYSRTAHAALIDAGLWEDLGDGTIRVIDWEEFKDMQLAYLKSSVVDMETLTDHAIKAALYKAAYQRGIKYILTGTSAVTEGIMGLGWTHNKNDYANIKDIHNKFGKEKRKTYPFLYLSERIYYQIFKNIKTIEILNYVDYNNDKAKKIVSKE